jgi:hypothetical protein
MTIPTHSADELGRKLGLSIRANPDLFHGQAGEPAFGETQPRTVGRRAVHMEARTFGKPVADRHRAVPLVKLRAHWDKCRRSTAKLARKTDPGRVERCAPRPGSGPSFIGGGSSAAMQISICCVPRNAQDDSDSGVELSKMFEGRCLVAIGVSCGDGDDHERLSREAFWQSRHGSYAENDQAH